MSRSAPAPAVERARLRRLVAGLLVLLGCVLLGVTVGASGASAAIDHIYDWVNGTPEGDWTSAAVVSDGSYGVPEGLISSFPVVSRNGRYEIVQGLEIDQFSRQLINASVAELEEERAAVQDLGLV